MNRMKAIAFACIGFGFASSLQASVPAQEKVKDVSTASVAVLGKSRIVEMCARGTVGSAGWTKPTLTPRTYVHPPVDGIWEVDFSATKPADMSASVVTPIAVKQSWPAYPASLKGIKVIGATNSVIAKLGAGKSACK